MQDLNSRKETAGVGANVEAIHTYEGDSDRDSYQLNQELNRLQDQELLDSDAASNKIGEDLETGKLLPDSPENVLTIEPIAQILHIG